MMARPVVGAGAILALLASNPALARADTATPPSAASDSPAASASSAETDIASWQNRSRAERGIASLRTDRELQRIARAHAENMARSGEVWHQADLPDVVRAWRTLGDNVARGTSAEAIYDAFIESHLHRANILDPAFDLTGVGASFGEDGALFVAVVFVDPQPEHVVARTPVGRTAHARVPTQQRKHAPSITSAVRSISRKHEPAATESVAMVVALASMSAGDVRVRSAQARTREIG